MFVNYLSSGQCGGTRLCQSPFAALGLWQLSTHYPRLAVAAFLRRFAAAGWPSCWYGWQSLG